jgi:hypothetical protein
VVPTEELSWRYSSVAGYSPDSNDVTMEADESLVKIRYQETPTENTAEKVIVESCYNVTTSESRLRRQAWSNL